jgi:hypothetical protein
MELARESTGRATATQTAGRAGAIELLTVALCLCVIIAAELQLTGTWWLFGRYFWLDEIYTNTLVSDPSLEHALRALASGVETHPPALYLLLRGYRALVHASDEVALRSFALLSVLVALVGIYACLRECFAASVCAAATLACWCHPLMIDQAFNARFYGPWLAAVVWCAYLLIRLRAGKFRLLFGVMLAGCALLVCTIHYFGVISLALVVAGEMLERRRAGIPLRSMLWTVTGPLALAACLPLLRGQRQALTETTWMADITLSGAFGLLRSFVEGWPLGWLALAAWLSILWGPVPARARQRPFGALWGLSALLALPLIMIVISYIGQPVYDARYCFPAVAGLAGAAAWIGTFCARRWLLVLCAWLAMPLGSVALDQQARKDQALWVDVPRQLMAELREVPSDLPIVFELPWQLYVAYRYAPAVRSRCYLLDYETDEIGNRLRGEVFARDLARRFSSFYPEPPTKRWSDIRRWPRFYLVLSDYGLAQKAPPVDAFYPGYHVRCVAPGLCELTSAVAP